MSGMVEVVIGLLMGFMMSTGIALVWCVVDLHDRVKKMEITVKVLVDGEHVQQATNRASLKKFHQLELEVKDNNVLLDRIHKLEQAMGKAE